MKGSRQDFIAAWHTGAPLHELASKFGISKQMVSRRAQLMGLPSRYQTRSGRPVVSDALVGGKWVTDKRGIARYVYNELG